MLMAADNTEEVEVEQPQAGGISEGLDLQSNLKQRDSTVVVSFNFFHAKSHFCLVNKLVGKPRAPDKESFLTSKMPISSPNPMFDHLLESSH